MLSWSGLGRSTTTTRVPTFHLCMTPSQNGLRWQCGPEGPMPSPPADSIVVCCCLSHSAWTRMESKAAAPGVSLPNNPAVSYTLLSCSVRALGASLSCLCWLSREGQHGIWCNVLGPQALSKRGTRRGCEGWLVSRSRSRSLTLFLFLSFGRGMRGPERGHVKNTMAVGNGKSVMIVLYHDYTRRPTACHSPAAPFGAGSSRSDSTRSRHPRPP